MKRPRLYNNFLKNRAGEIKPYIQSKGTTASHKKKFFASLNEKDIFHDKLFWTATKPLLSDKVMTRDRINLSKKGESVKTELETAEVLNKFFPNIVNNLEISKYSKDKSFIDNIEDQTLKAILKYKNHPSIIAIQKKKTVMT